jgi:hypothetical protein
MKEESELTEKSSGHKSLNNKQRESPLNKFVFKKTQLIALEQCEM